MKPEIIKISGLAMQICVADEWSNMQAISFSEKENPCGTEFGWSVCKDGEAPLLGCPSRNKCAERVGFIHMLLVA